MTDHVPTPRGETTLAAEWSAFGRTLILGNSGSGKSWLAVRMADALRIECFDLDAVHWEPAGHGVARDRAVALDMAQQIASGPAWIVEGVYGWLAEEILPRATALVWLDIPVDECLDSLERRGSRRGGDTASHDALLVWAAEYGSRQTSSSFNGHARIYTGFPGRKLRFLTRNEATQFSEDLRTGVGGRPGLR